MKMLTVAPPLSCRCLRRHSFGPGPDRSPARRSRRQTRDGRAHRGARASIEGNLEGESADRDVIVFLPPGYAKHKRQRYPVVYALHGFSIGAEQWTHEIHVPQTIRGSLRPRREADDRRPARLENRLRRLHVFAVPDTGDFEEFIAHDLVAYIDAHYRTIPTRESRSLVGHSMGGYGALRIGMKYSDVFGALYVMSPCCLSVRRPDPTAAQEQAFQKAVAGMKSPADAANFNFFWKAQLASAAAWSPDPKNPPLYLDLSVKDGQVQPDILAKWDANSPLAFIDQYIDNLRRYKAIAMDVGDEDMLRFDTIKVHELLDNYGLANSFAIYHGTHTSAVADRFQNHVLPFFSTNLCFTKSCQ